jgi:hypothetical protein
MILYHSNTRLLLTCTVADRLGTGWLAERALLKIV